ncbi:DUF2178 domain-containing protein [Chloroflexota bacterium]
MSKKTFMLLRALVIIIAATLISWSVTTGNALVPVPVAIAAIVILLLFRRGVKEMVIDERIYSIAEKASLVTFRVFGILAAITGATLVALSRGALTNMEQAGFTLAYSACALVAIYYIAYLYYNRKYSGKK